MGCWISGLFLLVALGPFVMYGRDYLYCWVVLTLPFCWLPLDWLLPSEWSVVLGVSLLAALAWGVGSYLVARFFWRRVSRKT